MVHWLEGKLRYRALAVTLVYVVLAAILGLLGWWVAPSLAEQGKELANRAPELIDQARQRIARLPGLEGQDFSSLSGLLSGGVGAALLRIPQTIMNGLLDAFIVLFLSIYWLIAVREIKGFAVSLFPARHQAKASEVLDHMGSSMGGYVRGAVINAVIMGVLAYIGLLLLGVDFPLVLGVLTMVGEIIPIVGPLAVGVVVTVLALLQSVKMALLAIALYTVLEQVEGHVLTPNIMQSQTDVPQTLVLFAIVVGAGVAGMLGILVSIPAAAALRVLVVEVLAPAERRMVENGGS